MALMSDLFSRLASDIGKRLTFFIFLYPYYCVLDEYQLWDISFREGGGGTDTCIKNHLTCSEKGKQMENKNQTENKKIKR